MVDEIEMHITTCDRDSLVADYSCSFFYHTTVFSALILYNSLFIAGALLLVLAVRKFYIDQRYAMLSVSVVLIILCTLIIIRGLKVLFTQIGCIGLSASLVVTTNQYHLIMRRFGLLVEEFGSLHELGGIEIKQLLPQRHQVKIYAVGFQKPASHLPRIGFGTFTSRLDAEVLHEKIMYFIREEKRGKSGSVAEEKGTVTNINGHLRA
jgi:hypothetical protein